MSNVSFDVLINILCDLFKEVYLNERQDSRFSYCLEEAFEQLDMLLTNDLNVEEVLSVENITKIIKDDLSRWCMLVVPVLDENSGLQKVQLVEQVGGGEGSGEYCYLVLKYEDIFYKISYNYYSYNGYEYDNAMVKQVTPSQKTITVYD